MYIFWKNKIRANYIFLQVIKKKNKPNGKHRMILIAGIHNIMIYDRKKRGL